MSRRLSAAVAINAEHARGKPGEQDHDQVLVLLRQASRDGAEVERDLRRLLPLKTKAEHGRGLCEAPLHLTDALPVEPGSLFNRDELTVLDPEEEEPGVL